MYPVVATLLTQTTFETPFEFLVYYVGGGLAFFAVLHFVLYATAAWKWFSWWGAP